MIDSGLQKKVALVTGASSGIGVRNPGQRLFWDSENMGFTNNEDANKLFRRKYREGWEL